MQASPLLPLTSPVGPVEPLEVRSLFCRDAGGCPAREQVASRRQKRPTVFDGVIERIKPADQESRDAEVVVIRQGIGHLLWCANWREPYSSQPQFEETYPRRQTREAKSGSPVSLSPN